MNSGNRVTVSEEGDFLVWRHPDTAFSKDAVLRVPAGYEVIIERNNVLSDVYREGSTVYPGRREGGFGLALREKPAVRVYFFRKLPGRPQRWGVGGIRFSDRNTNETGRLGALGTYSVVPVSAKKLLRHAMGFGGQLVSREIASCLEPDIIRTVRTEIARLVQDGGMASLGGRLDGAAEAIKEALQPKFEEYGIRIESFQILNVEIMDRDGERAAARGDPAPPDTGGGFPGKEGQEEEMIASKRIGERNIESRNETANLFTKAGERVKPRGYKERLLKLEGELMLSESADRDAVRFDMELRTLLAEFPRVVEEGIETIAERYLERMRYLIGKRNGEPG